jgi:hypothetical protein
MAYNLFDHVNLKGRTPLSNGLKGLRGQLGKLNARLDTLQTAEPGLVPGIYHPTKSPHIKKLKIRGNVQLRPRLCLGPVDVRSEFTLLLGAREIGSKDDPPNADNIAEDLRQQVKADPNKRRCIHERVE